MKHQTILLLTLLSLAACRPGQPCPSCDDDAADDVPADVADELPDLPCGGADLQTDNLNCGECGNQCLVNGLGEYETSGCVEGACAPTWFGLAWPEPSTLTCAEVCPMVDPALSCHANACVGLTAMVCESVANNACAVFGGAGPPSTLLDFAGACEDPVTWPEETEFGGVRLLNCCCG